MARRRRAVMSAAVVTALSGCTGILDDGDDIQDSDGDGVIDSEDYAPDDPSVQERSDIVNENTPTPTPEPTTESTPEPTTESTPEPTTQSTPEPEPTQRPSETIVDDRLTVNEDAYYRVNWALNANATLEYQLLVRDGPSIDVVLTTTSEFQEFEQGNRFRFIPEGTTQDTLQDSISIDLPPADERYYLIVDNTDFGEARPPTNGVNDQAVVEFEATLSPL